MQHKMDYSTECKYYNKLVISSLYDEVFHKMQSDPDEAKFMRDYCLSGIDTERLELIIRIMITCYRGEDAAFILNAIADDTICTYKSLRHESDIETKRISKIVDTLSLLLSNKRLFEYLSSFKIGTKELEDIILELDSIYQERSFKYAHVVSKLVEYYEIDVNKYVVNAVSIRHVKISWILSDIFKENV